MLVVKQHLVIAKQFVRQAYLLQDSLRMYIRQLFIGVTRQPLPYKDIILLPHLFGGFIMADIVAYASAMVRNQF
jgi:hypothetical protein